jgi:hypothetical protein
MSELPFHNRTDYQRSMVQYVEDISVAIFLHRCDTNVCCPNKGLSLRRLIVTGRTTSGRSFEPEGWLIKIPPWVTGNTVIVAVSRRACLIVKAGRL